MESLYFLIPLSIAVVALGIYLFFWAVKNGQYDDLDGEAERILFDELDTTKKDGAAPQQGAESALREKPEQQGANKEYD